MKYRIVDETNLDKVEALWSYCFEKKSDPFFQYYFDSYCCKHNTVIGGFEQVDDWDYLKTMVHVNPYLLNIRGVEQIVPYLVGVATAPEARGNHLMGKLLKHTFELLRSQGIAFVTLMPIFAGIYSPYGFSFCYEKQKYIWEAGTLALPKRSMEESRLTTVHMFVASEEGQEDGIYQEILPELLGYIYETATEIYHAVPKRNELQWDKLLSVHALEGVQIALVHKNGEPQGYMLYKLEDNLFNIIELLTITPEAKKVLLRYADAHKSEAKRVEWLAEAWDSTYLELKDMRQCPQRLPFMMARCVDAMAALHNINKLPKSLEDSEETLILLIEDTVLERNNYLVELSCHQGCLKIKNAIEQEQVRLDIAAFTQLYLGCLNATELWRAGRLFCRDSSKLEFLDRLFEKQNNWINEYF